MCAVRGGPGVRAAGVVSCVGMADRESVAALVRTHVDAFNERELDKLMGGFAEDAVWRTGTDTVTGSERLATFFGEAMTGLLPRLEITSLVADDSRAACELRESYEHEGETREASIAAFFTFEAELISRATVYREGSADP